MNALDFRLRSHQSCRRGGHNRVSHRHSVRNLPEINASHLRFSRHRQLDFSEYGVSLRESVDDLAWTSTGGTITHLSLHFFFK